MSGSSLWQVAVPTPLRRAFVYDVPSSLGRPVPGARVLVPFGPRRLTGYLLAPVDEKPAGGFKIRSVIALLDDSPSLPEELVVLLQEAAAYYMHPLGEVLKAALPAGIDYTEKKGELKGPRIKQRQYRIVRPAVGVTSDDLEAVSRRAPKRAELLKRVIDRSPVTVAALRAEFKGATGHVKRLAADGQVIVETLERPADRFVGPPVEPDSPPVLTDEQAVAVAGIEAQIERGGYRGFLLHGVTGSGKTEVYLRAIDTVRHAGRGALVLVPEIALTPQLVGWYRARFGDDVAVLHSGLTDRERFDQWRLLRSGQVQVAIGVRSAIFAPVENLGIIVVDEEHDSSFKQERGFHYNARDLALLRAARAGAVAVLGSATPSLESTHNADTGKLEKLTLRHRVTDRPLPEVSIIDMTQHQSGPRGQKVVSRPLFEAIKGCLDKEEQVILFLNRRGFAPALLCTACGELIRCDDCAVSLTLHHRPRGLLCHYCGARRPIPDKCAKCGADELKPVGSGTQKAETLLGELFPGARIGRLDRDAAQGRQIEAILSKLRRQELDILVGTQMVTKGHDFPLVTLVGVLNADVGLHLPDFRSQERSFQLLTQVAGRAGRSERGGRALIQTHNPDHPSIALAQTHDYETFAAQEIAAREELGYPPFGRLAALRLSSQDEGKVHAAAIDLFTALRNTRDRLGGDAVTMLGPVPAPLSYVQTRYRWRIMLRAPRQDQIRNLLSPLIEKIEAPPSGVRITLDIDPVSML
jgi:primosomal protein N' (replication factor Y)